MLYVLSALFMLSVVFVFLPWDWLNAFMALFVEYVYPDDSLVQYTVRMMLTLAFWFGVLMATSLHRAISVATPNVPAYPRWGVQVMSPGAGNQAERAARSR